MSAISPFLLGLASGIALLPIASYRRVSPPWLKWLLIGGGALVISRYVTMAFFTDPGTNPAPPQRLWLMNVSWIAPPLGLTLPSVFAVDQLIRHPAMTPQKLLSWLSPFVAAHLAVILFADAQPDAHMFGGWTLRLSVGWQAFLSLVQGVFVVGFLGTCILMMRKIPSPPIQRALLGLIVAQSAFMLERWYVPFLPPFHYSEILALVALWHAYETSAALQRA